MHFSLRLGSWQFSPSLVPSLAVLLLLPLLISLGFWQWHRAVTKQQRLDQFAARSQQMPQPLSGDEPIYTPVKVTGHYDTSHPILLDNRIINHQIGYDVFLPFIPADSQQAVLINLGWIPQAAAQSLAAHLPSPETVSIVGMAQPPEHNLVLAHPKTELRWPLLVEDIQTDHLSQVLNRRLYPFVLLLSGSGGFLHHWQMVTSVTPARHRGYAVQWWALALTLIVIYFKLNIRRHST